ncbi:hypothetical protein AAHE18_09G118400 [Arachis hypogaea]
MMQNQPIHIYHLAKVKYMANQYHPDPISQEHVSIIKNSPQQRREATGSQLTARRKEGDREASSRQSTAVKATHCGGHDTRSTARKGSEDATRTEATGERGTHGNRREARWQ